MNRSSWVHLAGAFALLLALAAQLMLSVTQQSQTWDESVHLFSGYQYWTHHDFGANPEHPPLVKLVAALPLLPLPLKQQPVIAGSTKSAHHKAAIEFLYKNTIAAESLLYRARMAASVFTGLLVVVVLLCSWEMFGPGVALLALALLVFEPNILANGALVTTDIAESCFLLAAVYTFYRWAKRPSPIRLLACGLAVALALASKHSGILLAPILIVLAAAEMLRGLRSRRQPLKREAIRMAFALAGIFAVGFVILWAFYGFHYSARPPGASLDPTLDEFVYTLSNKTESRLLHGLGKTHILPESYLWGLTDVLVGSEGRVTFLFGKVYETGQWFYFPLVLLLKTTLGFLLLVAAFPLAAVRLKMPREISFLALPPFVFLAFSMASGMNIGFRHILPVLPFLLVMAAAAAMNLAIRSRLAAVLVTLLVIAHAASSLHTFPNYLTYSNEIAGGTANTYRLVHGANVDWGQGLKQASRYLADRHVVDCWFAYSIPDVDLRSWQVRCKPLPAGQARIKPPFPSKVEGTVLIGANEADGPLWGPGELNPYKQFFDKTPDDMIGNSILVFHGSFDLSLASAYSHAARARELVAEDQLDDALNEAQIAEQLFPDSATVQGTRCEVLTEMHQDQEAKAVCANALSLARRIHPEYQFLRVPAIREIARGDL